MPQNDKHAVLNSAISTFHKLYRKNRAFKRFEQLTGINLEQQSQKNIVDLYYRLKHGQDLPDDLRNSIQNEKRNAEDALTPEELVYFKALLDIPLIANHATHYLSEIINSQYQVYSAKELDRRKIQVQKHTPSHHGEDDFVFLSYHHPKKVNIVNFLASADVLLVDLEQFCKRDPVTYSCMWTSGHFYAYDQQQIGKPVYYQTKHSLTQVSTKYHLTLDPLISHLRTHTFQYQGSTHEQTIRRESEISLGRHIKPFHLLRLIEYVRHLDPVTRKHILNQPQDKALVADLFDSIFTPGKAELHVPAVFQFSGGKDIFSIQKSNHLKYNKNDVFSCIDNQDKKKLKQYLKRNISLQTYTKSHGHYSELSLLHFAVLKKNRHIIRLLLQYGADPDSTYSNTKQYFAFHYADRSSLQDAIEAKDFKIIKTLCEPVKKIAKKAITVSFGANVTLIHMMTAIANKTDIHTFNYLLQRHFYDPYEPGQLLLTAILYNHIEALEHLLQTGANPDETVKEMITHHNAHLIPAHTSGTALTFAAHHGRVEAVRSLLKYGANVNTYIKETGEYHRRGKGNSALIKALTGLIKGGIKLESLGIGCIDSNRYTSLAPSSREDYITVLRTLLEAGADPCYISGQGTQFYRQCSEYLKNSRPENADLAELFNSLTVDASRIESGFKPVLTEYNYSTSVLITGQNDNGQNCLLLGKSSKNRDKPVFQFPEGCVNYLVDAQFQEAAIHLTAYLTGINLLEQIELSPPVKLSDTDSKSHSVLKLYQYRLKHPISNYKILKNTPHAEPVEEQRGLISMIKLHDIEFIPVDDIRIRTVLYKNIKYPVCTYAGRALPPFAAPQIAALCGKTHYNNSHKVRELAGKLYHLNGALLKQDIQENDRAAVQSLFALGINEYVHLTRFLTQAFDAKHYSIVRYLLQEGVRLSTYEIVWFFESSIRGKSHSEELVLEFFNNHRQCLVGYHQWSDIARVAGHEGFAALVDIIIQFDPSLMIHCARGAESSGHFRLVKHLLRTVSEEQKEQFICDVVVNSNNAIDEKKPRHKNQEAAALFCNLVSQYKGEQRKRLMLRHINSFYESMINNDISEKYIDKLLITLSRLLSKKEFAALHKYTGCYGTYARLNMTAHKERSKNNPEKTKRFQRAAERYFEVIRHIPIIQLEHAVYERNPKAIDELIDKYHQLPEIRVWTLNDGYYQLLCADKAGDHCLQRAVKANALHRVAFLLATTFRNYEFDINILDKEGNTPLMNAIQLGHIESAKLLITHGAKINKYTFQLAQELQHTQLAEMIHKRLVLTHNEEKEKTKMLDYHLIISTESPLEHDNLEQTGDVDYAKSIADQIQPQTSGRVQYCATNTKQILNKQLDFDSKNTVLHLMINAPRTGCALDLTYLKQVKAAGCKIIMTAIEFAKHTDDEYKIQTLDYLHYAERLIFLDDHDKNEALQFARVHRPNLVDPLNQAKVISVPPTISPRFISRKKTDSNIMCFGMLRTGKGFAHVTHLAELIKKSDSPFLKDKQIYITGSVQPHKTRQNGTAYDAALFRLLTQLYPQYKDQFVNKSPNDLVALYQKIKHIPPALPIKLFLNVPEHELFALFEQCKYAMYSAYRGVTLRNRSISTMLDFGSILYTFAGDITPENLRSNGEYHDSMVIFANGDYHQYAQNVANNLIRREKDEKKTRESSTYSRKPSLNDRTRAIAADLLTHELSLSGIALQHQSLYHALFDADHNPESITQAQWTQPGTPPAHPLASSGFFKAIGATPDVLDNTEKLPIASWVSPGSNSG